MLELRKKMGALGETMDAAQRREYERVVDDVKILKHEMEVVISYQFAMAVQDAEDEIAKCKDSQQSETLLRELGAELEDIKLEMLQLFGEDSAAYRLLVGKQKLVTHRLTDMMLFRFLLSTLFWLGILSPFLLWFYLC
ncbi:hypothetical protein ARMGADRAFT_1167661 [Armillaria gallica]|uniref:Uncharacterized protein n=1 Tax=Armillaria gallica TaxID=47427 RepID=A0A2H3DDA1_ARMGA|nr:hypothetical protein ARMGADRAFT_1167661 [Armillaria gallica]